MATTAKQCLDHSNKLIHQRTDKKTFISLFYGILDTQRHVLCYSNAGQNPPLLFSSGTPPAPLRNRGLVIGVMENTSYEEEEIPLNPGDLLVIYSDGLCEAMNDRLEEFGDQRLQEIVVLYRNASANEIVERILSAIAFYIRGAEQWDDMTLVVLKRK